LTASAAIPDAAVGRPKALANQTLNVTEKIFSQSPLKNTVKRRDFVSGLAWTSTTTVPATRLPSVLEFRKQSRTTETTVPPFDGERQSHLEERSSMLRSEIMAWTNPDPSLLSKDQNGEFRQVLEGPRSGKAD